MKKFHYKAKDKKGESFAGIVEAAGKKEAISLLKSKDLVVYHLAEKSGEGVEKIIGKVRRVSTSDLVNFTRQLATMVNAGLEISNSLDILKQQSNPVMAKIIDDIAKEIKGGSSLHKAMSKHPQVFSRVYLALIASGEAAGVLDKVLLRLADTLEKQREFKTRAIGSLIYPMVIVLGMLGVVFVMMIFVIPQLTKMFEEYKVELPITTRILITVSSILGALWPVLIVLFVLAGIAFRTWLKTPFGRERFDSLVLSLPILGKLLQKMILTEVTRTLSMLVSAGVSIIDSLNIVADAAGNVVFEKSLRYAAEGVEKGMPLTVMIARFDHYPPIVAQMVDVGEKTGKLGDVLARVSVYFEMETEVALKALTTAIEPIMIVVLGVGVGFLVIAIIMPIYTLTAQF